MNECTESDRTPSQTYPQVSIDGKTYLQHRVVWEKANGPIPDGAVIRHVCDNPRCINLDHLELGTYADNTQDMMERRRNRAVTASCSYELFKCGHDTDMGNVYQRPDGYSECRICRREQQARHRRKV